MCSWKMVRDKTTIQQRHWPHPLIDRQSKHLHPLLAHGRWCFLVCMRLLDHAAPAESGQKLSVKDALHIRTCTIEELTTQCHGTPHHAISTTPIRKVTRIKAAYQSGMFRLIHPNWTEINLSSNYLWDFIIIMDLIWCWYCVWDHSHILIQPVLWAGTTIAKFSIYDEPEPCS